MKLFKFLLLFYLAIGLIVVSASPALNQTGNQSDAIPNVVETTNINNLVDAINPTVNSSETSATSSLESVKNVVDRAKFESFIQEANTEQAILGIEEAQAVEIGNQLGLELYGQAPTNEQIARELCALYEKTGKKSAIIYMMSGEQALEILAVFPETQTCSRNHSDPAAILSTDPSRKPETQTNNLTTHKSISQANRPALEKVLKTFRNEITNPARLNRTTYLESAQTLYQWMISPIEQELQANQIDILVFVMDVGLRSTPIAALHDGKQFLVEKYSMALIPSFGLTDSRYVDVRNSQVLAMGASQFSDQQPLPAVPVELSNIVGDSWKGTQMLNEQFTLENFKSLNRQQHFGIIHLATHGEFQGGKLSNSYIQFWDGKLSLDRLREVALELGWNGTNPERVELMVLSACKTAVGNEQAELGFAGLAIQTGVKAALASLWYVSDAGTLALMNEFYQQLKLTPVKAEALRQTQLAMLKGQIRIEGGKMYWRDRPPEMLPAELASVRANLAHPYFWSAFTLIGNWD